MINIEYINGSINLEADQSSKEYESFMESCKNDINMMFADFDMMQEKISLESAIMGTVPEHVMMVYESEKKNIFARIGEMVIAIYNKFVEFIDSIIDHFKTLSFKKKSDLQKLDILLKNHPELKNEAIVAFNEGALDLSDVRSLKELDATFDEILKMARKKDIDPKTLRGKWEKAKENFEKDTKTWKIVKVAAVTTSIIGAAVAVKTFAPTIAKATNDLREETRKSREEKAEILQRLKEDGIVNNDTGKWQTLLQIWRELHGKRQAICGEYRKKTDMLADGIVKFLDKYSPDKNAGKRLQSDLDYAHKNAVNRTIREQNRRNDEEYAKAYARAQASSDYRDENPSKNS